MTTFKPGDKVRRLPDHGSWCGVQPGDVRTVKSGDRYDLYLEEHPGDIFAPVAFELVEEAKPAVEWVLTTIAEVTKGDRIRITKDESVLVGTITGIDNLEIRLALGLGVGTGGHWLAKSKIDTVEVERPIETFESKYAELPEGAKFKRKNQLRHDAYSIKLDANYFAERNSSGSWITLAAKYAAHSDRVLPA